MASALTLRRGLWGLAAVALLVPLVAMQFTREVDWSPGDFAAAALLVGGLGVVIELAVRRLPNQGARLAVIVAAVVAFTLIWLQLAVGLIPAS